jgi:hypothetical protein
MQRSTEKNPPKDDLSNLLRLAANPLFFEESSVIAPSFEDPSPITIVPTLSMILPVPGNPVNDRSSSVMVHDTSICPSIDEDYHFSEVDDPDDNSLDASGDRPSSYPHIVDDHSVFDTYGPSVRNANDLYNRNIYDDLDFDENWQTLPSVYPTRAPRTTMISAANDGYIV